MLSVSTLSNFQARHKLVNKTVEMKFLIVFTFIVAVALAAPPKQTARKLRQSNDDSANAQILKYENDNIGIDGYNFA